MKPDAPAWTAGIHLGKVVDDRDPMGLNRVSVDLIGLDLTLWAPVLIPGGGTGYGVALTPRNDDIVAVAFPGGDPAQPLVLGALWSGSRARPQAAGDPNESYAIVSPGGAVIRMEDREDPLKPAIDIRTDNGTRILVEGAPAGRSSSSIRTARSHSTPRGSRSQATRPSPSQPQQSRFLPAW